MAGTTTTPEQKQSYSFLDVPEIRVWASGDVLIIRSAALGKERRISLADLGIHLQNTDAGTTNEEFEIAYQSENQSTSGISVLAFGGKQGGRRGAIGFHWDETTGDFELKQCLNYTGSSNDSWANIGSGNNSTTGSVRWQTAPTVTISGDTISATTGIALVNGVLKDILAESIIETLPAAGFMRPCLLVGNYPANPGEYEVIPGTTVAENASFAYPALPADRLLVTPFIVRNSGIQQTSPNPVTSVTINGGAEQFPNAQGELPLTFEGGGSVDTVNGQVPDGSKNVTVGAEHIDYTPADSGFFGSALLKVKAMGDILAAKVKAILPDQTGQSEKFLQTYNGLPRWATPNFATTATNKQVLYALAGVVTGDQGYTYDAATRTLQIGYIDEQENKHPGSVKLINSTSAITAEDDQTLKLLLSNSLSEGLSVENKVTGKKYLLIRTNAANQGLVAVENFDLDALIGATMKYRMAECVTSGATKTYFKLPNDPMDVVIDCQNAGNFVTYKGLITGTNDAGTVFGTIEFLGTAHRNSSTIAITNTTIVTSASTGVTLAAGLETHLSETGVRIFITPTGAAGNVTWKLFTTYLKY